MPASDISRFSEIRGGVNSERASKIAKDIAQRQVSLKIKAGEINPDDRTSVVREYKSIYNQEYYKHYAQFTKLEQHSRIVYIPVDNPSGRKFHGPHSVVKFSKVNQLIQVRPGSIRVEWLNYPLDDETFIEGKEAFLSEWPGPISKFDLQSKPDKEKISGHLVTLLQHDSTRKIRYINSQCDGYRKKIIQLLLELISRGGNVDAPCITKFLLTQEQTDIQKDEKSSLETLQKYLLLGKRAEAIKFSKSRRLWDHAQCLAFLDKYQPPNSSRYVKDRSTLKDDSIVQLIEEYINSLEVGILSTVYRSLLNRMFQSEPQSINTIKVQNVGNDEYQFAILSANDCEMEFDQSNEVFKLVLAIKQALRDKSATNCHLISLGFTSIDSNDLSVDYISHLSQVSFKQCDTHNSRTLTISNIDLMILNEIWEYCLNLTLDTCTPNDYRYLVNLIPYKLIFASKLLDFGEHKMFADYLISIKDALSKMTTHSLTKIDEFYDWTAIDRSVQCLSDLGQLLGLPVVYTQKNIHPQHMIPKSDLDFNLIESNNPLPSLPRQFDYQGIEPEPARQMASSPFEPDPPLMEDPYSPIYNHDEPENINIYQDEFQQQSQQHYQSPQQNHFNKPPQPVYQLPSRLPPQSRQVNSQRGSIPKIQPGFQEDQPQQEYQQQQQYQSQQPPPQVELPPPHLTQPPFPQIQPQQSPPPQSQPSPPQLQPLPPQQSTQQQQHRPQQQTQQQQAQQQKQSQDNPQQKNKAPNQQPGFLLNLVGTAKSFLPKSNSNQMFLPDDDKKDIVYVKERGWVNTAEPESADNDGLNEPPPMMPSMSSPPSNYSFGNKPVSKRYPKSQFNKE